MIDELYDIITKVWCKETAYDPQEWNNKNPSIGQCAVTSLLVNDFLGGQIIRGEYDGGSHYWNITNKGLAVDFTIGQFKDDIPSFIYISSVSRQYLLSNVDTRNRYTLLRKRYLEC